MMAFDEEKFRQVVVKTLGISPQRYNPELRLGDIDEWDSVAHLDLVAAIESTFDIRLTTDEMLELTGLADLRARIQQAS